MSQDRVRVPIVLDIESEPDLEWIERTKDAFIASLEPPSNYKNAEAIANWFETKVQERVQRAALSPIDGRITAIAVARLWDDEIPYAWVGRGREAELIDEAISMVSSLAGSGRGDRPILAGWRINGFDVPFLTARAALHNWRLPSWWPSHPKRYGATLDGAEILSEGRLHLWLERFGLPPKLGDGKDAPNMPDAELLEYVRNDVHVERALLQRLSLVSPEIAATNPLAMEPIE